MIATLSMYDWPETSATLDRFWMLVRDALHEAGIDAPDSLHHVEDQMPLWTAPDLVIGQTCGWPYVSELKGRVIPFARFDHGIEGCPPGYYRSILVGRDADCARYLQSAEEFVKCPAIAVNGADSQSGYRVFGELPGALGIPPTLCDRQLVITGAHRESIKAVAAGKAEIAAIDAVAFELAKRHEPKATARVSILGHSSPKPGLPLITARTNASIAGSLFNAVTRAFEKFDPKDQNVLLLNGLLPARHADYSVFEAPG